jgi:peptidoglycan/xylan/chitin deacetylase (PgdA/CDA1 family)
MITPDGSFVSKNSVRILCYHRVVADGYQDCEWSLGARDFERQIRQFAADGFQPISLEDVHNWQTESRPLPARPLVLTFDDGHEGFLEFAAPVLSKYNFRATIFVLAGQLGKQVHLRGGPPFRIMSRHQVATLTRSGFEIQSHGLDHSIWTLMTPKEIANELAQSAEILKEISGRPVKFAAYPYGVWSPQVRDAVEAAGYLGACTTMPGLNHLCQDRFLWKRDMVLNRKGCLLAWGLQRARLFRARLA